MRAFGLAFLLAACVSAGEPTVLIDTRAPGASELARARGGEFVCVTGTLHVVGGNAHFSFVPSPPPGLVDLYNNKVFVQPQGSARRRALLNGDTPTFCGELSHADYHGSFDLRAVRAE
ncbi:MAG: hypothetical protein R3C30_10535 [Hyphomonadaceae bacterium]